MKSNNPPKNKGNAMHSNAKRPDVRDNLDSRKNEEWQTKGDDVTHNKKETEAEKSKKK